MCCLDECVCAFFCQCNCCGKKKSTVTLSLLSCPARAEAEQTKYLLVAATAAAYTATELMMKEFVSADEPILYALVLLAHYFLSFILSFIFCSATERMQFNAITMLINALCFDTLARSLSIKKSKYQHHCFV